MTRPSKGGDYEDFLAQQTLAFTPIKQSAFLGFLFDPTNGLYKHYAVIMDASWFASPDHQLIFKLIQDFVKAYQTIPTAVELKESNILAKKETPVQNRIRGAIDTAIRDKEQFHLPALIAELEDWKNAKIFSKAIETSANAFNKANFGEVATIFTSSIKALNETSFVQSEVKLMSETQEILDSINGAATIPFGINLMDNHLFDGATAGGLQLGDQTLLMGSSNGGKTTTMITCVIHNVRAENHVLFMTHEGTHQDIRQKLIRCYLSMMDIQECVKVAQCTEARAAQYVEWLHKIGSTKRLFSGALSDPNSMQRLVPFLAQIDRYLTYLPYHRAGMEVEKIVPIIERHQSALRDSTGQGYKLLAVDYPALLNTEQAAKGRMDVRHKIDYVYQIYVQLALANGWHSLVASQSNREGSKVNSRTNGETRLLGMEDNAEAWGPITTATNVITINRSPEAQQRNRVLFRIVKSRSSKTGLVVSANCNFEKCITHSNALGGMTYTGNSEFSNVLDMHQVPGVMRALTDEDILGGNFGNEA